VQKYVDKLLKQILKILG